MDGTAVSQQILSDVATRAEAFAQSAGRKPTLVAVLVGDDPGSATYVKMKRNRARKNGLQSRTVVMGGDTSTEQLVDAIAELSADPGVDGILLQHPVPAQIGRNGSRSRRSSPARTSTG